MLNKLQRLICHKTHQTKPNHKWRTPMDPHRWPIKSRTTCSNIHTYIQQLCEDTGCNTEDLPKAMNDREKWREGVRDIRASGVTWWWWWWWWWLNKNENQLNSEVWCPGEPHWENWRKRKETQVHRPCQKSKKKSHGTWK